MGTMDAAPGPKRSRAQRAGGDSHTSFVMLLWLEAASNHSSPTWRWRVVHVQTGVERHFARVSDVLGFISSQSGVAPPSLDE